jgi:hypothetical protein
VDGSVQPRPTAGNPSGRVRALISPRKPAAVAAGAPVAAGAASATATPVPAPAVAPVIPLPTLRPSTSLGGDKK